MRPQKGDDPKGRLTPEPSDLVTAVSVIAQTESLLWARCLRDHDIERIVKALKPCVVAS